MIAAAKGCGGRGVAYSAMKAAWTLAAANAAKDADLPLIERARFTFWWHEKKANRDPDNISAAQKFILDGLKDAGVIPNDTHKHILGLGHEFVPRSKRAGVEVIIEPR
jgi:hypothetical protein